MEKHSQLAAVTQIRSRASQKSESVNLRGLPNYPDGDPATLVKPNYSEDLPQSWSGDLNELFLAVTTACKGRDVISSFKDEPVANTTMLPKLMKSTFPAKWRGKWVLIPGSVFYDESRTQRFIMMLDIDQNGKANLRRLYAEDPISEEKCKVMQFFPAR